MSNLRTITSPDAVAAAIVANAALGLTTQHDIPAIVARIEAAYAAIRRLLDVLYFEQKELTEAQHNEMSAAERDEEAARKEIAEAVLRATGVTLAKLGEMA